MTPDTNPIEAALVQRLRERFVHAAEAAGKTIERVSGDSRELVLVYTDGTYTLFEPCTCYGDPDIDMSPIRGHYALQVAVEAGLCTPEEQAAAYAEREAVAAARRDAEERRAFALLKAKYEGDAV